MEAPGLFGSSCGARAGGGLDCLLGDVFGGRKAKQRSGPAERKAVLPPAVFMLHRCHNLKRTSPSRLSMKQADPALHRGSHLPRPSNPTTPPPPPPKFLARVLKTWLLQVFRGNLQHMLVFSIFFHDTIFDLARLQVMRLLLII